LRSVFSPLTGVFARYVGVGFFGTAIHFVTMILCVSVVGLKPGVGATVGAIAGAVINYLLNYNVTFHSKIPHASATVKFGIVALAGILASAWGVQRLAEAGVNYVFGQMICTAAVLVFGFFLNRAWTFRATS
jgi:putative flippase GtrA